MEWSLVTVIPNTDLKVGKVLRARGFLFHVFRHAVSFFKSGKKIRKVVLTYPRYVFVPSAVCWEVTHVSDDILSPVRFGDCIAKVPDGFVEDLSSRSLDDVLISSSVANNNFRFGQKVLLTGQGHLAGQVGTYLRPASTGKAVVELFLMGMTASVILDESSLLIVNVEKKRKRNGHSRNSA